MLTEKQIKRLNNKFNSLTKAEQRVLIAKDVIAQIKAKRYKPNSGRYMIIYNGFDNNESVQKHVDEIDCVCCALGACLISTTKFKNKLTFGNISAVRANGDVWGLLKNIFTPKQLAMIEYAFEVNYQGDRVAERYFSHCISDNLIRKSIKFGVNYFTERARMVGIMQNIINNNGTFKP